ncbi:reverse transcriptase [Ralstonia solanacearum]|nr:reverse transcriptase [Ralstonia solanacearum]
MPAPVKLPSGPLIHYWKFCRLIAEALQPINKNPKGIDCVWAKSYPAGVPSPYAGTDVPLPLDEADREALAKVLPKLPPLKYPMSERDIASFTEAYVQQPNRPLWMPVLVTEEAILGLKIKRDQVMDRHIAAIREERRAGRLVPVDANYVPLEAVEIGAHLTRKDAIAYLERHGMAYVDEETATSPEQGSSSVEAAHLALDTNPLALSSRTSKVGHPQFSAATKAAAVKRSKELEVAGVKDHRERAAKEYGTTSRSIYKWVKEDEEMEERQEKKPSLADFWSPTRKK